MIQHSYTIVGFCNPLLDTIINVANDELIKKYRLQENEIREIGEREMKDLTQNIATFHKEYGIGGSIQNTLKILQWIYKMRNNCVIVGSIGNDPEGQKMSDLLKNEGVATHYVIRKNRPTGKNVVINYYESPIYMLCLGAAEIMTEDDLKQETVTELIEKADLICTSGFFLTKREAAARYLLNKCKEHNKKIVFNIGGVYLTELVPEVLKLYAENSNYLFGNKNEFRALAKLFHCPDENSLISHLTKRESFDETPSEKIIVITDGSRTVKHVYNGIPHTVPVVPLEEFRIKDTTGAGDAFMAGYMAGILKNWKPTQCIELACYASSEIIQQTGCTVPLYPPKLTVEM